MKNYAFSNIWIIGILAVILAVGIFAWQYFGVQKQQTKSSEQQKTQDETANWKTYEWVNNFNKISFEYPPNWVVEKEYYSTPVMQINGEQPKNVGLLIYPQNDKTNYIHIDGRQNSCDPSENHAKCSSIQGHIIFTDSKNLDILKIFDQMLSTFKFTDQNQTTDTSNWKTYKNDTYGFEVKYPVDTRVSETSNYTLPFSNTDKDIIVAIQSINKNYPRSLTGLNVFANSDVANCLALQGGEKNIGTKSINGVTFSIFGENLQDDAMGGLRSLYNLYRFIHGNMCYSISSSVFWRDVQTLHDDTDMIAPTAQELQEQQTWIQTQQQLNNQVLSTFQFLK